MGASICWAAADADTQFANFDSSAPEKQLLIFIFIAEQIIKNEEAANQVLYELFQPPLETYLSWLKGSGLVSGMREAEFLITLGGLLNNLNVENRSKMFTVAKRGLSLPITGQTPGREIAYVTYAKRNWRDWFRGILM